jgi:transposase
MVKKKKTCKLSVICDHSNVPLSVGLYSGNLHDIHTIEPEINKLISHKSIFVVTKDIFRKISNAG